MSNKFKIGDKVRVIDTDGGHDPLYLGAVGTVMDDDSIPDVAFTTLPTRSFREHRLELVSEEPAVAPHTGTEERLMIEALPKGGFKINRPSTFLHREADELAAFSTLSEAVAFIGREMRA